MERELNWKRKRVVINSGVKLKIEIILKVTKWQLNLKGTWLCL